MDMRKAGHVEVTRVTLPASRGKDPPPGCPHPRANPHLRGVAPPHPAASTGPGPTPGRTATIWFLTLLAFDFAQCDSIRGVSSGAKFFGLR